MSILKEMGAALKGVLAAKVPTVIQSGYQIGERVEYIDPDIVPVHYGTVVRLWEDKVKVTFDGFENGTWVETDVITREERNE
jgi:DNA-binding PadR family transcriptional regulator